MKSKKIITLILLFSPWLGLIVIGISNSILKKVAAEKLLYLDPDGLIIWFGVSGVIGLLLTLISRQQSTKLFRIGAIILATVNVLASIASFSMLGAIDTGKARYTLDQMEKASKLVSDYSHQNKKYPDSLQVVLPDEDSYDAWGYKLQYSHGDDWFELRSYAADRTRQEDPSIESTGKDIIVRDGVLVDGPETLVAWWKAKRSTISR